MELGYYTMPFESICASMNLHVCIHYCLIVEQWLLFYPFLPFPYLVDSINLAHPMEGFLKKIYFTFPSAKEPLENVEPRSNSSRLPVGAGGDISFLGSFMGS